MRIKSKLPLAQFVKVKVKAQKLGMRNNVISQPGHWWSLWSVTMENLPFHGFGMMMMVMKPCDDLTNPKMLLKKSPIPPTPLSSPA